MKKRFRIPWLPVAVLTGLIAVTVGVVYRDNINVDEWKCVASLIFGFTWAKVDTWVRRTNAAPK